MNPQHRDHDQLLIVRLASGDADAADRAVAERQLSSCEDCRALLSDVQAIRSLTSSQTLRVPPRPRSFRLSPVELKRVTDPPWRRWLAGFGTPPFDVIRPLSTAVAGIGLAVAVLGSFGPLATPAAAPVFQGLATSVPATDGRNAANAETPAATAAVPASAYDLGPPRSGSSEQGGAKSSAAAPPAPGATSERNLAASNEGQPAPLPLAPVGLAVLGSGLAVVALNTAARRAAGR